MRKLAARLRALRTRRDDGASAVEYGLLVALIAVFIASAVLVLGQTLEDKFDDATTCIDTNACP